MRGYILLILIGSLIPFMIFVFGSKNEKAKDPSSTALAGVAMSAEAPANTTVSTFPSESEDPIVGDGKVVPYERIGAIRADVRRASFEDFLRTHNVTYSSNSTWVDEGTRELVTTKVLSGRPDFSYRIQWDEKGYMEKVHFSPDTKWALPAPLGEGITFQKLQSLNRKPFTFNAFGMDPQGLCCSFQGGALDDKLSLLGVYFHLDGQPSVPPEFMLPNAPDSISSDHPKAASALKIASISVQMQSLQDQSVPASVIEGQKELAFTRDPIACNTSQSGNNVLLRTDIDGDGSQEIVYVSNETLCIGEFNMGSVSGIVPQEEDLPLASVVQIDRGQATKQLLLYWIEPYSDQHVEHEGHRVFTIISVGAGNPRGRQFRILAEGGRHEIPGDGSLWLARIGCGESAITRLEWNGWDFQNPSTKVIPGGEQCAG